MHKVFWLFDFKVTEKWNDMWQSLWKQDNLQPLGLPRSKKKLFLNLIKGSKMALRVSKKDDIIFSWFDFQAVICFIIGKLTFRRRQIVALNVMCKFNNSFKGKLYALLYKWALSSNNFYATVTSKEYGNYLNKMLGINRSYIVIHDANEDKYPLKNKDEITPISNSVFMGGTSSRDWDFAFALAKAMPEVTFNFVMTESMYNKYKGMCLPNTNVKYAIPLNEFNELAVASTIIMMISTTEAPAGLMLLFLAAANNKFYITNYTATSCEYITNERGCILPKIIEEWKKAISYYLSHPNEANSKAKLLNAYIAENCSLEKYVEGMKLVCDCINSKLER